MAGRRAWLWLASWRFVFAVLTLVITAAVWALTSIVAVIQSGAALGFAMLVLGALAARKIRTVLTGLREPSRERMHALLIYLVLVPIAVALLQLAVVEPAVAFSGKLAIRNRAPLIADIETYRLAHGRYPPSLLSVWRDYSPGVIGIERYHYEPHGDAYNLMFEQFTYRLGTREFVVYNPRDEKAVTAHAFDLLQLTPEQLELEQQRGHYEVHDAPATKV